MSGARQGMTLLEVLVALVILGTVGVGILEVFAGTARVASNAEQWSRAVAYAEQGMETVKLDSVARGLSVVERLEGGFSRRVEIRPWSDRGLAAVTVAVTLPGGGEQTLIRIMRAQ